MLIRDIYVHLYMIICTYICVYIYVCIRLGTGVSENRRAVCQGEEKREWFAVKSFYLAFMEDRGRERKRGREREGERRGREREREREREERRGEKDGTEGKEGRKRREREGRKGREKTEGETAREREREGKRERTREIQSAIAGQCPLSAVLTPPIVLSSHGVGWRAGAALECGGHGPSGSRGLHIRADSVVPDTAY